MGHLNGILARVGGNLNNNFQKSQMPGWLPGGGGGGMLKLRFDRYITFVNLISGVRKAFDIMGFKIRGKSGTKLVRNPQKRAIWHLSKRNANTSLEIEKGGLHVA